MTDRLTIASIVEGHGEVKALPPLIRRVASECFGRYDTEVTTPHRVPRSQMLRGDVLPRAVLTQAARITGRGGVLLVLDSDDDCPVELAHQLAGVVGLPLVHVAVANREFEAWFLAGIESLRSHPRMRDDAAYVGDPDLRRDAAGALSDLMHDKYNKPLHQPAFASLVSIDDASRRSRSFRHFVGVLGRLIEDPAR